MSRRLKGRLIGQLQAIGPGSITLLEISCKAIFQGFIYNAITFSLIKIVSELFLLSPCFWFLNLTCQEGLKGNQA